MSIIVVPPSGTGLVDSVNTKVGVVVLDPDDLVDTTTTNKFVTTAEKNTWNGKQAALGYTPENVANLRTSFQVTPDDTHYISEKLAKDSLDAKQASGSYEVTTDKDATGGYAGLTLFKINFKNALNTIISFFTNSNTVARTYTFQDRDGTIADNTDLAGKSDTSHNHAGVYEPIKGADDNYVTDAEKIVIGNTSGTNTGDQLVFKTIAVSGQSDVVADTTTDTLTLTAGTNITITTNATTDTVTINASGGAMTISSWLDVTGTYASANTFTCALTTAQALAIQNCLFTCLNTGGGTRRIGYVKSATETGGAGTVTVVTDTDLASGDNTFKVTPSIKLHGYERNITIPEELVYDITNPQGIWYDNIKVDSYLLPVDSSVRTAAAGAGAAAAFNVYKDTTNLFSAAQDLTTNNILVELRPTTNTISATDTVSVRVTNSAGATNKAKDLQVRLYIVPQSLFTGAA